jgi:hypothetical protein
MTTTLKYALAAALILGASSASFAGDGYPNTNYPSGGYSDSGTGLRISPTVPRAVDAFAFDRGAAWQPRPSGQQDRQTSNVNNN